MSDIRFNRWLHQSGTGGVYQDSAGNVGIGTSVPTSTLDIVGTVNATTLNVTVGGSSSLTTLNVSGVTTFSSGPVLIGSGTSTGTASQPLQVTGGAYVSGNLGIGTTNPVKTIDVRGEATFGAGITISDLNWAKDTNQLVYSFSGTASGSNPADGCLAIVNPNANPSASRIGSIAFGNKVSGTTVTGNPGIKAVIDVHTNTNVANAADTGGYMNFYTKPDNANNRVQMILNSNGVLTKPYQPAFLAYRNTTLSVTTTWQNISQGILTESYDVGPVYSTSTNGRFIAPVAGKYMFYAGGWSVANSNGERYAFGVKVNNGGSPDFITGGTYCIYDTPLSPYQVVLNLAANDYVELFFYSAITTTIGGGTHWLYWGGYLLG